MKGVTGIRRLGGPLVLLSLLGATVTPAGAEQRRQPSVVESNCDVFAPVIDVKTERVKPFVPQEFTLQDIGGMAQVQLGAVKCQNVELDGQDIGVTTWVFFRAILLTNPSGDTDQPGESNSYEFFLASSNPRFVNFFIKNGADRAEMVYVRDLVFDTDTTPGTVTIEAPSPTPSPFTIRDAEAHDRLFGPTTLIGQIWGTGPDGWWQRGPDDEINGVKFGVGSGLLLIDDLRSMMAYIFECHQRKDFFDAAGHASFTDSFYTVTTEARGTSPTTDPRCE